MSQVKPIPENYPRVTAYLAVDGAAEAITFYQTVFGGKERMRRLMEVISAGRADLRAMVTHRFKLDRIEEAYDLFSHQRDGVMKIAITP